MPFELEVTNGGGGGKSFEEVIPEGVYVAEVVSVEPGPDNFGKQSVKITFEIVDDEECEGETVTGLKSATLSSGGGDPAFQSHLYKWYTAIVGEEPQPGARVDLEDDLVGKRCQIQVVHKTGRKRPGQDEPPVFANVGNVMPLRRRRSRRAPAPRRVDDFDDDNMPF